MAREEHRDIWKAWHQASIDRDDEALLALYADDALLEAPLISMVLKQDSGVIQGREGIRHFLEQARRSRNSSSGPPAPMHWWREEHFFSAGDNLIWEYPRVTPDGDQIDIVEVMRIADGLIAHHKVYWGWNIMNAMFSR